MRLRTLPPSEEFTIRPATTADLDIILKLLYGLKSLYGSTESTNIEGFRKSRRLNILEVIKERARNQILLASKIEGTPVGMISLTVRLTLRENYPVGSVEEIFIDPDHRKKGVATMLWEEAASFFKSQKVQKVEYVSSLAHPGQREFVNSIGANWYSNIHLINIPNE